MFRSEEDSGSFAQIDVGDIAFDALNGTIENEFFLVLVLGENDFALGFTQTLSNNLLGSLSSHATEVFRKYLHFDHVGANSLFQSFTGLFVDNSFDNFSYDSLFVDFLGFGNTDLEVIVLDGVIFDDSFGNE